MINQFKYGLRIRLSLRLWCLGTVLVLNTVFGVCGAAGLYGLGGQITAVTLSSFALCGVLVVNVLCNAEMVRGLFGAPSGYLAMLAPVPASRVLGARVLLMLAWDLAGYALAIAGVVIQSAILSGGLFSGVYEDQFIYNLWTGAGFVLYYLIVLLAIFFVGALSKSLFYRSRARVFLAAAATGALLYAFHWLTLILRLFGQARWQGVYLSINIDPYSIPALAVQILLLLAQAAALFFATAYLMERKINI